MKSPAKQILSSIILLLLLAASVQSSQAATAYLLDAAGLQDIDELWLVGTLQGVVNRDAPRLFLNNVMGSNCDGAGNTYVKYLESQKGFKFIKLRTLNDAIATFASLKRADGVTPLIKGMVKYQTTYWDKAQGKMIYKYYNNWIAGNFCAQEDLIPVTDRVLNNQSQMLSGTEFWYKDTAMSRGWGDYFVTHTNSTDGRAVTTASGRNAMAGGFGCSSQKMVYLDLAVTPKIEVVVSDLSPGGVWSLVVAMGSTVNTYKGCRIPELTNVTTSGTFTVDLAASGLFNPTSGRARIAICTMKEGTTVTVKSIRFLDANGQDPVTPLYDPPKNEFSNLKITRDLTVSRPYADDEASACTWSLANQRANCDPYSFGSFAPAWDKLMGVDYAIAKKSYLFYQPLNPFGGPYPNLDIVLAGLKQPLLVHGWIANEDYSTLKMAQFGGSYAGSPNSENWSFWQWVPLDKPTGPVLTEPERQVTTLENMNYVSLSWGSSDATELAFSLMCGFWGDPNRGKVPITWGFNPTTAEMVPALVEYFGKTATPNDSFWNGVSGAGYTEPSCMPDSYMALYAAATRKGIQKLGTSSALDYWDWTAIGTAYWDKLTKKDSPYAPVKLIATGVFRTFWLDNGTPVISTKSGTGANERDNVTTPEQLAANIQKAAKKYPENDPNFSFPAGACPPLTPWQFRSFYRPILRSWGCRISSAWPRTRVLWPLFPIPTVWDLATALK